MMETKKHFISHLVDKHSSSLLRFLTKRLKNQQDAADVAQDAYLKLYSLQHPELLDNARAFLFQTASNMAIDQLRRKNLHTKYIRYEMGLYDSDDEGASEPASPSAEHSANAEQQLKLVYEAISDLPSNCKQAFLLQRSHGLTYTEIAREMNVSTSAVEKYISQALKQCHRKLLK